MSVVNMYVSVCECVCMCEYESVSVSMKHLSVCSYVWCIYVHIYVGKGISASRCVYTYVLVHMLATNVLLRHSPSYD